MMSSPSVVSRHRLTVAIDHGQRDSAYRRSQRRQIRAFSGRIGRHDSARRRHHGGFRNAVVVDHPERQARPRPAVQDITSGKHHPQSGSGGPVESQQLLAQRRRHKCRRDALSQQPIAQRNRIGLDAIGRDDRPRRPLPGRAISPRPPRRIPDLISVRFGRIA